MDLFVVFLDDENIVLDEYFFELFGMVGAVFDVGLEEVDSSDPVFFDVGGDEFLLEEKFDEVVEVRVLFEFGLELGVEFGEEGELFLVVWGDGEVEHEVFKNVLVLDGEVEVDYFGESVLESFIEVEGFPDILVGLRAVEEVSFVVVVLDEVGVVLDFEVIDLVIFEVGGLDLSGDD